MRKHYVTFLSPGTFVAESTTQEICAWNIDLAVEISRTIKERYGACPYGFYFTTRTRGKNDFDSKQTAKSNMYYLGGKVETLEELKAKHDPNNTTLISNMECNKWDKVITNCNSWKWTQPLKENDVVLEYEVQSC